ncbi:uncharacterized protein LOC128206147 isoform X3 [Mya arenaria]|uniref:uncharacterized protein LOC128206147 isoform X3 n=1 Tax=Mya arenaria TaxID=6604 RepID=UPI0022E75992|nr:uncharacterized protein LOC128206147 isoform X3 [Mya arenaria]
MNRTSNGTMELTQNISTNFFNSTTTNSVEHSENGSTLNVTEKILSQRPFVNATSGALFEFVESEAMKINIYPLVFAFCYAILGFIGNTIVIYVYLWKLKKNRTRVFILCLGILDWLNCTFSMPLEIAILLNPLSFDHHWVCKITRGCTYVINNTGSLVFVSIAIERFLVVHYPIKSRQLTPRFAKGLCLVAFLIASVVSWPSYVFYGTHTLTFPIPKFHANVIGKTCLIADEHENRKGIILIYTTILFTLLIFTFVVLSTLYIAIGRKIYMATCTDFGHDEEGTATKRFGKSIISALTGVTKEKDVVQLRRQSTQISERAFETDSNNDSGMKSSLNRGSFWKRLSLKSKKPVLRSQSAVEFKIDEEESCMTSYDTSCNDSNNYLGASLRQSSRPPEKRLTRKRSTIKMRATRTNTIMMRVIQAVRKKPRLLQGDTIHETRRKLDFTQRIRIFVLM